LSGYCSSDVKQYRSPSHILPVTYASRIWYTAQRGHVVPDEIDAEIAMSAEAMGCDGTGHNKHVADKVGNSAAGERGARNWLAGEDNRLNRIGLELTDKGTVDEYGADEIYDKVTNVITPDHNWYRNQEPFPNPFEQINPEQPPTHKPNKWRTRQPVYPTYSYKQY
jgi:hypothetical protein